MLDDADAQQQDALESEASETGTAYESPYFTYESDYDEAPTVADIFKKGKQVILNQDDIVEIVILKDLDVPVI